MVYHAAWKTALRTCGRPQLSWQPVVGLGVCLLVSYRNIQYCRLFRTLVANYQVTTFGDENDVLVFVDHVQTFGINIFEFDAFLSVNKHLNVGRHIGKRPQTFQRRRLWSTTIFRIWAYGRGVGGAWSTTPSVLGVKNSTYVTPVVVCEHVC